jgi:ABC-type branched-subunit amino acid transport system ATPase component/ABC-type branched-subunit amino acid transport system permease subunit
MVLAGAGGVLVAPLFSLSSDVFTEVVLGSLAAAVLGGLRSIPIAFAGGLGLGVVENLVAGYSGRFLPGFVSQLGGLKDTVPYLLVLVVLMVAGRERGRRAGTIAEDAPRADHRGGLSRFRRRLPWAVFGLLLVAYSEGWLRVSWLSANPYHQTVIAQGLAIAIILLSFVVATGTGGMISLAQGAFVTIGGFAAGWALNHQWATNIDGFIAGGHLSFFWAALFGAAVAAVAGIAVGLVVTRLDGVNFALATLAVAFAGALLIFQIQAIGNGQNGWAFPQPSLSIPGLNWLNRQLVSGHPAVIDLSRLGEQILLFLLVFLLLTGLIHRLSRSASGRAALAVRSSSVAAEACGISSRRTRIALFALSAAIAGVGGVMLGLFSFSVSYSTAPPIVALTWLAVVVTFGVRRPAGALLGGLGYAGMTAVFQAIANAIPGTAASQLLTSTYFLPILSGLGAIQLAMEPDGILAFAGRKNQAKRAAEERARLIAQAESGTHDGSVPEHERRHGAHAAAGIPAGKPRRQPAAALRTHGVVAGYGDAEILHGIDLAVRPGEIVALLGANGAGKSTLCSVIAGTVAPRAGSIHLADTDATRLGAWQRARLGALLIPEARGIFPGLTVEDNLAVYLHDPALRARAYELFPMLAERRRQVAGVLSGGQQQILSLASVLASPPAVVIADEPTLGLAPMIAEPVIDAIVQLKAEGTAVLLAEEHAGNALSVADRVIYMALGSIVWEGPRDRVNLDQVGLAYLGGIREANTTR